MPKVGNKHFPYTKAGYKAAAKARKKKKRKGLGERVQPNPTMRASRERKGDFNFKKAEKKLGVVYR